MAERAKDSTSSSLPEARRRPRLDEVYAALEALLRASPRGRWFLAEYAKRNRTAETDMLLEAIGRIERAVLKAAPRQAMPNKVFAELVEMSEAIARTRREIAQIKPPQRFDKQLISATVELDQIVEATERATSDILQATEEMQEAAWTLRELGTGIEHCDKIDQRATDIYTACSFQDITGQRMEKVVKALRFIEQRINAMIEIWGVDDIASRIDGITTKMQAIAAPEDEHVLHGPQPKGEGLKQDDVDRVLKGRDAGGRGTTWATEGPASLPSENAGAHFDRPEPLTLRELAAIKRAALFG